MLVLPQQLTQHEAADCLARLQQAVRAEDGMEVVLDAAPLEQFDSAALAVLLALRRICQGQRKILLIRNLPARLGELAQVYGVAELLGVADLALPPAAPAT